MTASIRAAEAAVIAALESIPGLRCFDYLPDSFTPPTAIVGVGDVDYHGAFGMGDVVYTVDVMIIVARASERAGQAALDDFMSPFGDTSIRQAVESDKTLGGVVSTSLVNKAGNLKVIAVNTIPYISVDFSMTVHA